jgi:hypothetical protein
MKPHGLRLGCRDSRPDRNTGAAARRNRGARAYPRSRPAIRTGHETPSPSQGQLRGSSSSLVHVWRPSPWTETTASVDSTLGRPYGLGMWTLGLRLIPAVVSVAGPPGIRPGAALITRRSVSSLCLAAASWVASPVRQTVVKTLPPNLPSPPPRVAAWVACFGDLACWLAGSGDGVCHGRVAPPCRDFGRGKKKGLWPSIAK